MADELLELLALLKDSMSTGKKGWEGNVTNDR